MRRKSNNIIWRRTCRSCVSPMTKTKVSMMAFFSPTFLANPAYVLAPATCKQIRQEKVLHRTCYTRGI